MKLRTHFVLQLAALCLALGATSFAADNAYLYLIHGIPGRDIADNVNPGFPVDILVDGNCLTRGLAFDSTSGPLTFAPGTYDIQISEANSLAGLFERPGHQLFREDRCRKQHIRGSGTQRRPTYPADVHGRLDVSHAGKRPV